MKDSIVCAIIVFISGLLIFNWPLLTIAANRPLFFWVYFMLAWMSFILLIYISSRPKQPEDDTRNADGEPHV